MCLGKKEERQRIDSYLGLSRSQRILGLLCEFIGCILLLTTGFVEVLFGYLNYIPDERKVRLKNKVLCWLKWIDDKVKKLQYHFHKIPPSR